MPNEDFNLNSAIYNYGVSIQTFKSTDDAIIYKYIQLRIDFNIDIATKYINMKELDLFQTIYAADLEDENKMEITDSDSYSDSDTDSEYDNDISTLSTKFTKYKEKHEKDILEAETERADSIALTFAFEEALHAAMERGLIVSDETYDALKENIHAQSLFCNFAYFKAILEKKISLDDFLSVDDVTLASAQDNFIFSLIIAGKMRLNDLPSIAYHPEAESIYDLMSHPKICKWLEDDLLTIHDLCQDDTINYIYLVRVTYQQACLSALCKDQSPSTLINLFSEIDENIEFACCDKDELLTLIQKDFSDALISIFRDKLLAKDDHEKIMCQKLLPLLETDGLAKDKLMALKQEAIDMCEGLNTDFNGSHKRKYADFFGLFAFQAPQQTAMKTFLQSLISVCENVTSNVESPCKKRRC